MEEQDHSRGLLSPVEGGETSRTIMNSCLPSAWFFASSKRLDFCSRGHILRCFLIFLEHEDIEDTKGAFFLTEKNSLTCVLTSLFNYVFNLVQGFCLASPTLFHKGI